MKNKHLLVSLLMIAMISAMISPIMMNAKAEPVPQSTDSTAIVWQPGGQAIYLNMTYGDPQFLQLYTKTSVFTDTTVIIDGRDALGANIEAEVFLPASTISQKYFIFNDSQSGLPVAFAWIDNIYQQGGTDGVQFKIMTYKLPFPQYLGEYENTTGWAPGAYAPYGALPAGLYYYTRGYSLTYGTQAYPDQPTHPEQLQVLIHWEDKAQPGLAEPLNLIPDFGAPITEWPDGGAQNTNAVLYIEGLNEHGNKWTATVTIPYGATHVDVPMYGVEGGYGPIADCTTFATVCKVWGGLAGDSYYIVTEPQLSQDLFTYTIRADHLAIWPKYYDILANPGDESGSTPVMVALEDADNNLVYAHADIIMNFFTSGGTIIPSEGRAANILNGTAVTTVTLRADTNARTIKVTADANVPAIKDLATNIDELNLFVWTNVVFDGVNSVFYGGPGTWPIVTLQWGYTNAAGTVMGPFNVPPKPVLPTGLGGPEAMGIKLDGPVYEVMISLYVGCNLISSPVHPMMGDYYDQAYPTQANDEGIPMSLLFASTSAVDTIEAVWWYRYGYWFCYVPKTDTTTMFGASQTTVTGYFTSGQGYWIKAEKPCTLELSGVYMENGPFTPPTDHLEANVWSLRGFTSVNAMSTTDYLESVNTGTTFGATLASAAGPVWVYHADSGSWERDPAMLYPTYGFWVYNKVPQDLYIAP